MPERNHEQRFGWVIGVKQEHLQAYKDLHARAWPKVQAMIRECHIRNYSIYLARLDDDQYYLFSYLEYTGRDFEADMAKMAADETTQKWWDVCKPCQRPCKYRAEGDWWMKTEEVFHLD